MFPHLYIAIFLINILRALNAQADYKISCLETFMWAYLNILGINFCIGFSSYGFVQIMDCLNFSIMDCLHWHVTGFVNRYYSGQKSLTVIMTLAVVVELVIKFIIKLRLPSHVIDRLEHNTNIN